MNVKIVTAIYDLRWDKFGGRPNRLPRYVKSLETIARYCPDVPIYCYTNSQTLKQIRLRYPSLFSKSTVNFIVEELEESRFHDEIQSLKHPHIMLNYDAVMVNNRCFELLFSKFKWIKNVFDKTNADYVFWLDAGLLHQDVFDISLASNRRDLGNYSDLDIITSERLQRIAEKKKGLYFLQTQPHNKGYTFTDGQLFLENGAGIIGGLFGIYKDEIEQLTKMFYQHVRMVLNRRLLLTEESIMTSILKDAENIIRKKFTVMGTRHLRPHDITLYSVIKEL